MNHNSNITPCIISTGSCVPDKILTNKDLEGMVDTNSEWIITRTGIEERRIAAEDVFVTDLAVKAGERALQQANMKAEELDMIIMATITPDMFCPSAASIVQHALGASKAVGFDINAACSGFIYAVTIAGQFIQTEQCRNILVIGADVLSKITDWKDRNTCVLFGDGAGAVVMTAGTAPYGILSTHIGTNGSMGNVLTIPSLRMDEAEMAKRSPETPRSIWMDGSEVFKFAVKVMAEATLKALEDAGLSLEDVDLIVPHQANIRIVDGAAKRLKISKEKIFTNIHKYGNMSAASIPVALDEAVKAGMIQRGHLVVLVGFGGGLTWGSAAVRWQ